jgi:ferredoxin-like protein FixX
VSRVEKFDVTEKLGVDKFAVNEGNPHIDVDKKYVGEDELQKVIKGCPAALYDVDENGNVKFDFAGCLECGTCRVLCGKSVVKEWNYPESSFGVEYRYG